MIFLAITVTVLNFIYFFSVFFTLFLFCVLINGLFSNFAYEDNIMYYSEDHLDETINKVDYVYEKVYETDIELYDFRADEHQLGNFNGTDIEQYRKQLKFENNFDDFATYLDNKNFYLHTYFELNNLFKLFFNNEGLIFFFYCFYL